MQTVSISGFEMMGTGPFQLGTSNGCAVSLNGRNAYLTIPIPTGAKILAVNALIYDTSGLSTFSAALRRYTFAATGDNSTQLALATGGEGSIVSVTKDITPTSPETVDPGERFAVYFDDGVDSFGNGLCGVSVTYQLAATGAALTAPLQVSDPAAPPFCDDPTACRIETP